MEPNNNNQMPPSPLQQQPGTPVVNPVTQPQPVAPEVKSVSQAPKKGPGKGIILIVLIFILMVGLVAYIIFAQNNLLINDQQPATDIVPTKILPTATPTPAEPSNVEEVTIEDPELDLKTLDEDLTGL